MNCFDDHCQRQVGSASWSLEPGANKGARMPFNFAKYEQWRRHPMLNNNLQRMLPGLGIGTSAFIVYVIYDKTLGAGSRQHS